MPLLPASSSRRRLLAALSGGGVLAAAALAWRPPRLLPPADYVLLDGRPQRSDEALRGRVALIQFWATSCRICLAEMPDLVALQARCGDRGLTLLTVAMAYDPPASVVRYVEGTRLALPVAIDNTGRLAQAWGPVEGTPTALLVDRRGRIVRRWVGALEAAERERAVQGLLAEA